MTADWQDELQRCLFRALTSREDGDNKAALGHLDEANRLIYANTGGPPKAKLGRKQVTRWSRPMILMRGMVERGLSLSDAARSVIKSGHWKGQGGTKERQHEALLKAYRKVFGEPDTTK
jgi:hypothetical protein